MKGYQVDCGYMGYIPSRKGYCLFATEADYEEVYLEEEK